METRGAVVILVVASAVDAVPGGAEVVRIRACEPLCRSNRCHPPPVAGVVGEVGPCRSVAAPMEAGEATIGTVVPILPPV